MLDGWVHEKNDTTLQQGREGAARMGEGNQICQTNTYRTAGATAAATTTTTTTSTTTNNNSNHNQLITNSNNDIATTKELRIEARQSRVMRGKPRRNREFRPEVVPTKSFIWVEGWTPNDAPFETPLYSCPP